MTIQEIYDSWALKRIEYAILDLHRQSEKGIWGHETARVAIHELLEQRKYILNDMFEENDYHKQLLTDLNEAIKLQMIEGLTCLVLLRSQESAIWDSTTPNSTLFRMNGQRRCGIFSMVVKTAICLCMMMVWANTK